MGMGWYKNAKDMTLDLLNRTSAPNSVYVAIGSSSAPITSILKSLEEIEVVDLPLSGIRKLSNWDKLSDKAKKKLEAVLQPIVDSGQKNIVLIDYASTGNSMIKLKHILSKYLEHIGSKQNIEAFVMIGRSAHSKKLKKISDAGIQTLQLYDTHLQSLLWLHHFRQISPYERYMPEMMEELRRNTIGSKRFDFFQETINIVVSKDKDFADYKVKKVTSCLPVLLRVFMEPALR